MKRLLILAYDFPPYVSVGGLRPYAWYKYLKEFDVYPIVVTRQWGNKYGNELDYVAPSESAKTIVEETEFGTIIRTPYKPNLANRLMLKYGNSKFVLLRKAITAWYEFMQLLFFVGPKSGLYRGAKAYLKENKIDAIIATGEPFILFKYASALSGEYGIPWIADYRDPWTGNKNREQLPLVHFWERRFMKNAAGMTTVDEFFKRKIGENVPLPATYIIPNGFNPDSIKAVEHIEQGSDVFRIAMTGSIYEWHPYKSVISAFVEFVKANSLDSKIELNFFGINRSDEIRQFVSDNKLEKIIHVYPRMANASLLENLCKHNVMLLFNDYSHMGTKIYDYLAIRRKIILCYGNDADSLELKNNYYPYSLSDDASLSAHLQEDCLNETKSGVVVRDKNHLMSVLRELFDEFSQNGCVECHSINIDKYSRKEGARQLAEVVKHSIS
ncbi:MAG: glycosyltransferase [Bacteroidales bacterium]|nr:glycosyltransferase [Bacteroidales bacterium]